MPKWTGTGCTDPARSPDATYLATARLAVVGSATAVLLTGCLIRRVRQGNQDANRNADAKNVELVIGKSSAKGGQGQCCAGVFGEGGSTAMNLLAGKVLSGSDSSGGGVG